MNILVVGTGGFGKLRGEAFAKRGHEVAFASRSRPDSFATGLASADAVFVATPPACHSEPVIAAALAGKPVLVEKPAEATLERARALERRLGGRAALVGVAENYRFLPQITLAREALEGLGALRAARVRLLRPRAPGGWRVERALSGGGVLADMGVHYLHLLHVFLGALTVTSARELARVPGTECDAAFELGGASASGARWSIELSWCSWRRASSVTLEAERGAVRFRVGKPALWRVGFLSPFTTRRATSDFYGHEALTDAWLASVARGEPPPVSLAEGVRDLANVEDAYSLAHRSERR